VDSDPIISPPTLAGFITWAKAVMGVTTTIIPDNSSAYTYAFQVALAIAPQMPGLPDIQTLTTYNIAGSQLLMYAQDQTNQTFFTNARKTYGMNSFVAGVINSAGDESTHQGMTVGKQMSNMDLLSLQLATNPYGRQALAFMGAMGSLWGLS